MRDVRSACGLTVSRGWTSRRAFAGSGAVLFNVPRAAQYVRDAPGPGFLDGGDGGAVSRLFGFSSPC